MSDISPAGEHVQPMLLLDVNDEYKGFIYLRGTQLSYLGQDCDQGASQLAISIRVIERHCPPSVTAAASSPNTVDILVNIVGEVKVHHMLHIWNIQPAGSNRGCYQDRTFTRAEVC